MKAGKQKYRVLIPDPEVWQEFQELIQRDPEVRKKIEAAFSGRSYIPPTPEKREEVIKAVVPSIVEEMKEESVQNVTLEEKNRRFHHPIFFPDKEDVEKAFKVAPKFIQAVLLIQDKVEAAGKKIEISQVFKILNATDNQKSAWYNFVRALDGYNYFYGKTENLKGSKN